MELGVGEEKPGYRAVAAAALQLLEDLGLRGNLVAHLDPVPHAFTHLARHLPSGNRHPSPPSHPQDPTRHTSHPHPATPPPRAAWADPFHLDDFALPVAQQKIAVLLRDWLRGTRPRASG